MPDALFGMPLPKPVYPERLLVMHRMYGKCRGHLCGDCRHFLRYSQANTWFKCELTVQTGGTGTDWRAKWPACGKFE